jgi:hypothetical protein
MMETFAELYGIFWAILAIFIGSFGLFFTENFITGNVRNLEWLYAKTHFGLFKAQAEQMVNMSRIFIKALGLFFIVLGVLILLGIIKIV